MGFNVAADTYLRFMGRYSEPLADQFCGFAGAGAGQRALDVGCGPGALTERLVAVLGPGQVAAVDPSPPFVAAVRERCPGVEVRQGSADPLPYADDSFDLAVAQLVLPFMPDPRAGLAELVRVTRPGGTVAACVWDHAGGRGPITPLWTAIRVVDPQLPPDAVLAAATDRRVGELLRGAGLDPVTEALLAVTVDYADFEDWWQPNTTGVGPAGDHVRGLSDGDRERLRQECRRQLGAGPFTVTAAAAAARGTVR